MAAAAAIAAAAEQKDCGWMRVGKVAKKPKLVRTVDDAMRSLALLAHTCQRGAVQRSLGGLAAQQFGRRVISRAGCRGQPRVHTRHDCAGQRDGAPSAARRVLLLLSKRARAASLPPCRSAIAQHSCCRGRRGVGFSGGGGG